MLEPPQLKDQQISACLRAEYGLAVTTIAFLPLGADLNTAVYRAAADDGSLYFVKLRKAGFNPVSVTMPGLLFEAGLRQVIPALKTKTGRLWTELPPFKLILYPFVEGQHAYDRNLSPEQWVEFGAALKKLHQADVPAAIQSQIPRDDFSPKWCQRLKHFLGQVENETFADPVAAGLADFLKSQKAALGELLEQTQHRRKSLHEKPPEFVLCHADIHGWNLLIDKNNALFIVDWDTLVFAPKERDLMFIGGGLGQSGYTPQQEESLFYQGYRREQVNQAAITYYRCARIIEDIALYCEQLLLSDEGGQDRPEALENVKSNFLPNGTIAMAYRSVGTAGR
jgi:spectinomycin phosphotransferase